MHLLYCQVIPLESVMKKPKNMPRVLDVAAMVVVGINLPFALYGYLLFGDNTRGTTRIIMAKGKNDGISFSL